MSKDNISINEMIVQMTAEAERLGFSQTFIWADFIPRLRKFAIYYQKLGITQYDPQITEDLVQLHVERYERGEIGADALSRVRSNARKLNEFYLTGTFHIHMPKRGTRYLVSAENEHLIADFIDWKDYGPNTRDDVYWTVRKYLFYFEAQGYPTLQDVSKDQVREFILETASTVKVSTLHNILLYLKYFHRFLKESEIPAPDCQDLFNYKVTREMPIQGYVTDEELEKILGVIDTDTSAGKRNLAIILLAATTGLRACDITKLKLTDIDWRKGEFKIKQKKTGQIVYAPILPDVGAALQDYILNARPKSDCPEIFLRIFPPQVAIQDPCSIGCMFKEYQKKAGIYRHPFDGKGFHGLRRRLAKKLLITGTPLTTIAQILGHEELDSSRQYLSLDLSNLKECALDFRLMPVKREELL